MADMTIDEVARRAGTTSRNVRAYQDRGLLPPPRLVGRTGYYSEGHMARLRHIAGLLDRGFSLAAIRALFDAWEQGYGLAEVLGFEEALAAPWGSEPPATVGARDLLAIGGDEASLAKAVELGIVKPEGKGYRVASPRLLEAARRLNQAGLPMDTLLDEAERLGHDLDAVVHRWVEVFRRHVWDDAAEHGMSAADLQSITELLRAMRELLDAIVGPMLAQAMERKAGDLAAEAISSSPRPKAPRPHSPRRKPVRA